MTAGDIATLCMAYGGVLPAERPRWLQNSLDNLSGSAMLSGISVTERGRVLVEALKNMPTPVQSWAMPKQEEK